MFYNLVNITLQDRHLVVINVYCPRADPERADRKRYKLQFYKALDIRANRLRGRRIFVIDLNFVLQCCCGEVEVNFLYSSLKEIVHSYSSSLCPYYPEKVGYFHCC